MPSDTQRIVGVGVLVGMAAFALGCYRLHQELREINEHLEAIEHQAARSRTEAMSELEGDIEEQP